MLHILLIKTAKSFALQMIARTFCLQYVLGMKIESYCEMRTNLFVREGDIERISLSGKFRRARMA